ncbi:MAG: hypothetical protein QM755_08645 [Luteolibacter sp.]
MESAGNPPMEISPDATHVRRRDRSIRLAVATSLLSKAGTAGLQLLAIPIAIRVLGRAEFGIYTSVTLTLTTVSLFEVGVGPALAHGLAKASAAGDRGQARTLASTAFFVMLAVALLVGLVASAVLSSLPVARLYGDAFAGQESVLRPALWIGLGLFLLLFLLNLTERIREGYLEIATTNACGAAGNILAALAVAIGVRFVPEVWFLVVAIHGSLVLAKLLNTALLWKRHPEVIPSWRGFHPGIARLLMGDGSGIFDLLPDHRHRGIQRGRLDGRARWWSCGGGPLRSLRESHDHAGRIRPDDQHADLACGGGGSCPGGS